MWEPIFSYWVFLVFKVQISLQSKYVLWQLNAFCVDVCVLFESWYKREVEVFAICHMSRSRTVRECQMVFLCSCSWFLFTFLSCYWWLIHLVISFLLFFFRLEVYAVSGRRDFSFTLPCPLSCLLLSWVTSLPIPATACRLLVYSCPGFLFWLRIAVQCLLVGTLLGGHRGLTVLHSNFMWCVFLCR